MVSSRRQVSPGLHLTTRWQVRQRSAWYDMISESTACCVECSSGVSVRTIIPSATFEVQESWKPRWPSISTMQVRQPA